MKVKTAKTTIDLTGDEFRAMLAEKAAEALGEEVEIAKIQITNKYVKKADGEGYDKTDEIKRVRITC